MGFNSALAQQQFYGALPINVRFTPNSGHWTSAAKCPLRAKSGHFALRKELFDHLVGACEQLRRHWKLQHPGGLCIYDNLELRGLHYW